MRITKFYQFVFVFFLLVFCLHADQKKPTVCLNMIVRNESRVIGRCLASVKPIIDYWVIVDTGSTDGTQQIIKGIMQDLPGELHESSWVNFEHNRNEALALAQGKGDYLFFIDADEELIYSENFKMPRLDKDFYYVLCKGEGINFHRSLIVNNHLPWRWVGVLHEYIASDQAKTSSILENIYNLIRSGEGARSQDPNKFYNDAKILEKALKKDPNNPRYVFYLAKSYSAAHEYLLAIKNYEKRIAMGGWPPEVFWSMYQIALLQEKLQMDPQIFTQSYYRAFSYQRTRAEPLYQLARYYRTNGNYQDAYTLASLGVSCDFPKEIMFVEEWIYSYGLLMELSISAGYLEKYDEAESACQKLLASANLPQEVRKRALDYLRWVRGKIEDKRTSA